MIYYFVSADGDFIDEDDMPKDWYSKETNPDMFTVRKEAVSEARRRLKERITELQQCLKDMKCQPVKK